MKYSKLPSSHSLYSSLITLALLTPLSYDGVMTNLISYKRRKCQIEGCKKLGRNKGFYKGKIRYDRFCEFHHRLRYGSNDFGKNIMNQIPNDRCEVCGWDKGFCDRHRKNSKLGYTKENVKVLCPNCHRLVTQGLLKI